MNITLNKNQFILSMVAIVLLMSLSFVLGERSVEVPEPVVEVQEVVKYVEVIPEENFDVSVLENWGGDFSDGQIRMIGAWLYGQDNNGDPIVIDENGELWTLPRYDIVADDFLLIWVANNNTEDNVHDDLVMKVWVETYEKMMYEEVG
jgi:hypothetical protein